jgi:hypothetical protein
MLSSMMAGAAGAGALTLVHQVARAVTPNAPRMDVLGMRALRGAYRQLGLGGGSDEGLSRQALAGDLIANSAYYALVGAAGGGSVWTRGLVLGLAAGVGAILLPRPLGLGDPPNAHRPETQLMTIAWYVVGGLTAAALATRQAGSPAAARVAGYRPLARHASR